MSKKYNYFKPLHKIIPAIIKFMHLRHEGFTLIELLVVIAIIAILSVVVILTLNPAELLRQSHDSNRLSDLDTVTHALGLYTTDQSSAANYSLGSANTVYISIPDPSATSTAGDQCQGLGLPAISTSSVYTYHCAASSTYRSVNGSGWIPVNFSAISSGSPFGNLPVDPTNNSSSRLYYTYTTNGTQYEMTSAVESSKYKWGGSNDAVSTDGGTRVSLAEKGTNLSLMPLDYGDTSLIGYWPMDEGTGTATYDYAGNNLKLTWSGTQAGLNSTYYTTGKVGGYSGYFNGSNDSASHTSISALSNFGAGDFSIAFWINPQGSWSGTTQGIIGQKTNDSNPGFQIYHDSGDSTQLRLRIGDTNTIDTKSTVGSVPQNQWTFVVTQRQSGVTYIYINGTANASTTNTKNISGSTANFNIGYGDTWLAYYTGYLDDVRIYNRALSASEIQNLYSAQK